MEGVSYIEGIADKDPIIRPCMTCCRQEGVPRDWSIIGGDKPWETVSSMNNDGPSWPCGEL